jgi:hypothetical protein
MSQFNRQKLHTFPLSERKHKLDFSQIAVLPDGAVPALTPEVAAQITLSAEHIRTARTAGNPVMLTYGAHLIKNGMAPVIIRLMEDGYVTHVATNGAGSIHDWEFAYFGKSTEDVRANVAEGKFGIWEETGKYINLAVAVGGTQGLGYGVSIGRMIADDGLYIPSVDELRQSIATASDEKIGAFADLLYLVTTFNIPAGRMEIKHINKGNSVQYAAYQMGIPFTVHPGIGYDIIYTHPMNCGGAIGRGSVWDFLTYTDSVLKLQGGVHLSVGSAIMAPMIFEKALSMAKNVALQTGEALEDYYLIINDIQDGGGWNWNDGEPPMDNPAYYLRFCKSFYRMGGELDYICLDNRAFLMNLYDTLRK